MLHVQLSALAGTTLRGEVLPKRVLSDSLLILRHVEPEVTLTPLHYQHRAEIETEGAQMVDLPFVSREAAAILD